MRDLAHGVTELLVPFFLAGIGLHVDLTAFSDPRNILLAAIILAAAVVSKFIGCCRLALNRARGRGPALAIAVVADQTIARFRCIWCVFDVRLFEGTGRDRATDRPCRAIEHGVRSPGAVASRPAITFAIYASARRRSASVCPLNARACMGLHCFLFMTL